MNDSTSKYITLLLASVSGGYVFTSLQCCSCSFNFGL